MAAEQAASLAAGQQDLDRAVRALAVARTDFAHRNVQALQDAEEILARTALELAEAILGYELAEGTRTARAALARALSGNDAATVLAIRLHPADIDVLSREGQELPAGLPLIADASLGRGDAKVEYQHGWFDASLRGALDRARAALLGDAGQADADAAAGAVLPAASPTAEFTAALTGARHDRRVAPEGCRLCRRAGRGRPAEGRRRHLRHRAGP